MKNIFLKLGILFLLFIFSGIGKVEAAYENYTNNIPQPVSITADTQDLQSELEVKVQEMVSAGHMAPTLYFIGLGGNPLIFYSSPVETIYTLSAAYPYLSPGLKTAVSNYLKNEISSYPPHSSSFYPVTNPNGNAAGNISQLPGARREYFIPNPNENFSYWHKDPPASNTWVAPRVNPAALYAIWIYSQNTGDWAYATSSYNDLRTIYTNLKTAGITTYSDLSGAIGFARIAQHLGNTADYNDALAFAETGFASGVNFNQFLTNAKTKFPNAFNLDNPLDYGYTTPIFMFQRNPVGLLFSREVGSFLKDNAAAQAGAYASKILTDVPMGWLNSSAISWSESSYASPEISWTYFMLKAYVEGNSATQLKSYLDKPDRKGDLLYMQKLVAAIEAPSSTSAPCNLTSASWSTQATTTGLTVSLNVTGDTNCANKQVNLEVRRNGSTALDDIPATNQPAVIVLNAQGTGTGLWVAEHNPLIPFTDPQYYFKASTQGGNIIDNKANLLTVTSGTGGTPTPTPTATPTATATPTPTPTPTATPTPGSAQAIFNDDFEGNNLSKWTSTSILGTGSTLVASSSAARSGSLGLDAFVPAVNEGMRAVALRTVSSPASKQLWGKLDVNLRSNLTTQAVFLAWYDQAPVYSGTMWVSYNQTTSRYQFNIRGLNGNNISADLTNAPVINTWQTWKWSYDWSGTGAIASLWIDGTQVAQITDSSTGTFYLPQIAVGVQDWWHSHSLRAYFDNINVYNADPDLISTPTPTATPTPAACNLTTASWSTQTTTTGSTINLNVTGDNNCNGKTVNFEVRRNGLLIDDIPATIQPQPANISSGSATTTWVAEHNPLIPFTNPQYYFRANVAGGNTIDNKGSLLTVTGGIPTSSTDWPTLAHDNQRSGSTQNGPDGPYTKVWYRDFWSEFKEEVVSGYQPPIARDIPNNRDLVYIGTANGSMYAMDLNTGAQAWRYPQSGQFIGGILNSPTVEGGVVYVGSLDGNVYAIDGNSITNGVPAVKWTFRSGRQGGFWATPVVTNDSVYIGGRDGYFYAIDKNNGNRRWEANIGTAILTSPAFANGTIYFGAEDMKAYAFNTTGTKLWESSQLAGQSLRGNYPVISNDKVIFRSAPNDDVNSVLNEEEKLLAFSAGCNDYPTSRGWLNRNNIPCFQWRVATDSAGITREQNTIRNYLQGNTFTATNGQTISGRPQFETFHVLNISNGQKSYTAPILWTAGNGYPGVPPVVNNTGQLWVLNRSYYSDYDNDNQWYIMNGFGQMDPATGNVTLRNPSNNPVFCNTVSCNNQSNSNIWMIGDETTAFSAAGNKIYTNQWAGLGSINTNTGDLESIIGERDNFANHLVDHNPRTLNFGLVPNDFAGGTSYGPSVSGDKIIVNYGGIVAMVQGHLPGVSPTPIPTITPYPRQSIATSSAAAVNIPTQAELEHYIWEVPTKTSIDINKSADLRTSLETEVNNFLTTGRLNPWIFIPGKEVFKGYYLEPSETAFYLSLAYPYLSSNLQNQIKTFVNNEWNNSNLNPIDSFSPEKRYPWNDGLIYTNSTVTQDNNKSRQPFAPGPFRYCNFQGGTSQSPCEGITWGGTFVPTRKTFDRLYNIWSYAYQANDWTWIESHWDQIKNPNFGANGVKGSVLSELTSGDAGLLGLASVDPSCIGASCINVYDSANRRLSALIAYARIAQHMNDQTEVTWATNLATLAMQARLRYLNNLRPTDGNGSDPNTSAWINGQDGTAGKFVQRSGAMDTNIPQLRELTPEVARLLTDFGSSDVQRYEQFFDQAMPITYMQRGMNSFAGEIMYVNPHNIQSIFLMKSLGAKKSGDELRKYLDIPWVKEDLFYWERLSRTLEAYGTTTWVDLRAVPCNLTAVAWNTLTATQGSTVNLNVVGDTNCANKQVNLEVRRYGSTALDDILANIQPQAITLNTQGQGVGSWVSEFNPLRLLGISLGDPTYYFKASTTGGNTLDNKNNMLTVTSNITPTPVPGNPNDWPQVGKDPQHTGYSAENFNINYSLLPHERFKVSWTYPFQPDRVHPQTQAIIYQGKVFVGTEGSNGQKPTLYAIDAVNPNLLNANVGRVVWKFEADGSILNSAAAYDNKVFFATLNGSVYAVDMNGNQVWQKKLNQEGFSAAPLIADNKIMLGGHDGIFYGLNPDNGNVLWSYNTGAPIMMTAAFNKGADNINRAFLGGMNMYVYAINTADGTLSWRSKNAQGADMKIPGVSFKEYWPVVTQGKVVIIPQAKRANAGINPGYPLNEFWDAASPQASWYITNGPTIAAGNLTQVPLAMSVQDTVMQDYQNNPGKYTDKIIYLLDETTGRETTAVPNWNAQSLSGAQSAPCVDKDGYLVIPVSFLMSGWGRLDLGRQRLVDVLFDNYGRNGQPFSLSNFNNPAGFGNADENLNPTCAGNTIFSFHVQEGNANYTGAFDLTNRRWTEIGAGFRNRQMSTQLEGRSNPASISNGKIYHISTHELIVREVNP
ncbi:MAG: PQQ-binding-like beta-propeller repeat protein [Candidatus Daviesbacteria bacterium]|nr:PQQ-binding-like beta-propeller repeat protein [Candidatus Daviesbacteria bacterium]